MVDHSIIFRLPTQEQEHARIVFKDMMEKNNLSLNQCLKKICIQFIRINYKKVNHTPPQKTTSEK